MTVHDRFHSDYPLRDLTTFNIGGPARYYFEPQDESSLMEALLWCRREHVPYFIIGAGSNILVSDEGFPGLAIKLGGTFDSIDVDSSSGTVRAGGAVRLPALAARMGEEGWTGYEFMAGIPATVGGAVIMNAGSEDGAVEGVFVSASVITQALETRSYGKGDMNFSYRSTELLERGGIVVEAVFALRDKASPEEIKGRIREILVKRKRRQPAEPRNCGSVFKNPPGEKSAGWYLEQAGMKGQREGGAEYSEAHANWIVNTGGASAGDVKVLVERGRKAVLEHFGLELEREVKYIPEDLN